MKELLRTRGLESWVHPSVLGGRRGGRRGGKGGRLLDNFLDTISDEAEAEGITQEAVRERLSAVTGPKRHSYLLLLDVKSWGDEGGRLLDNFLETVRDETEAEGITQETVRERLSQVTGPKRHPYLLLLDAKSRGGSNGGKGGANRTDYDGKVAALVLEGHTTATAEAHLRGQQGAAMYPLLTGKLAKREGRVDSGNAVNLAAVELRVRVSHPSLDNFNLKSIFSPDKKPPNDR